jgi:prolycopene isomerase
MGSAERPGPLRAILNDLGVMDKLEFVEMENLYRVVWPDTFDITLRAERNAIVETLQDRFPKERVNIPRIFDWSTASAWRCPGPLLHGSQISREKNHCL